MTACRASCVLLLLPSCPTPLLAQTSAHPLARTLHGKVVKLKEGLEEPVANANVTLEQTGKMVTSNSAGLFIVPLSPEFLAGEEIKFNIEVPGYAIFQPVEGRTRIPRQLQKDVVIFELLPRGSPKFLSHEHLTALLKNAAEKSTEQVREQKKDDTPPELGRYLKDWAQQYGFGIEQVKAEVDRWVGEVEQKQDSIYELGLAAFARKNFAQAGALFQDSASQKERKLLEARESERQLSEGTIRDYRLGGDAYYNDYNFRKAAELYQKALSLADRVRSPRLWAAILANYGNARLELGVRTTGEEAVPSLAVPSLKEAKAYFENALQVFTREQLPQDWAATENSLGLALGDLAGRSEGSQAAVYLEQAVSAYRNALQVRTREQLPQDWAMTQNNLGIALRNLAGRSEGPQAAAYLEQAVAAYRNALQVRTREQLPRDWAMTQNNLGNALDNLAGRSEASQAATYLEQAVAAYRNALRVFTSEQLPQDWAGTQNNLGAALDDLAGRSEASQAATYLEQAVSAYRNALQVFTREQLPQDWARTLNNLGTALGDLAGRSETSQATAYLEQAIGAFRNALQVYTREQLPQAWAATQNNLGVALGDLAGHSEGSLAADYLEQAVGPYRGALEVRTESDFPLQWTRTMWNLALIYEQQKDWAHARETYAKLLQHYPNDPKFRAKVEALANQR